MTRENNEREMRQLMAEAIVLARSAPTEFTASMPVSTARGLLDQLSSMGPDDIPMILIGDPVREATAASSAWRGDEVQPCSPTSPLRAR